MKTKTIFRVFIILLALFSTNAVEAADPQIIVQTNPDGAEVYLNGRLISGSTPAVVSVSSQLAGKSMIFQFVKDGYESKTMTLSFSKKELKNQPVVRCNLKKIEQVSTDPGVRVGHQNDRVSRDNSGKTDLERSIIRWYFDSDPRGARIFWRVISSVPDEVKNTNETYLTTTPYEETRGFNILGLTYDNARDVTIEVKLQKRGYEDQVKRFNARQCLDQQEISGFFELVEKEERSNISSRKKKVTVVEEVEESDSDE